MKNWRSFPEGAWSPIGGILSGFGGGEGAYASGYAVNVDVGPFLNGRLSACIRLAGDRVLHGAGIIGRADALRSFLAFYIVTDNTEPSLYSVRLGAFKQGRLVSLVGIKQPISLPDGGDFHISLQFFSGEVVGQVHVKDETHALKHVMPELPFPGYCGVVRFYGSSAVVHRIQIEEIAMKPILPEENSKADQQAHSYRVFLSHSSADKTAVMKVTEAFKAAKIPYWVDHEQITFGDGIVAKIEEGLQNSKYVVVCLSENLRSSGWCRAEYGPILYREFSGDTSRRVIPLSLDGSAATDAVPLLLSDKMRANFADPKSFSAFIQFLREST